MIYSSLVIPRWLRDGIRRNDKGSAMRKFLYGGDTETMGGRPITFQFYSEQPNRDELIWIHDEEDAAHLLLKWCKSLKSHAHHVVYVHNLQFDMVSFFWNVKEELVSTSSGEFEFEYEGWRVSGVYGAPTYAKLTDASSHRTVFFVDSYSYYRAGLAAAAQVFCPDLPKLEAPEGLGERFFTPRDTKFVEYAMRDAVVAYHIGVALEALHQEFDLTQTVSVADMAARIFRHRYLEDTIPQPNRPIIECALNSYHGGKNNLAVAPGWYTGVKSLDISSAYPHAMASFPSFYVERAYKKFAAKKPRAVPELGVYRVRGRVTSCDWPVLFGHDFTPLRGENVPGVCVSGYELNEALRSGEFKPTDVVGWFYDRDMDPHDPPLARFVNEFYARKEAEQDKAKRAMYKFILNSISGKFIQTRKRDKSTYVDVDDETITDSSDLMAGGMFHPFIASLITGHTRARIHQLEHTYHALHTATDGIFTRDRLKVKPQTGLGAVVNEAEGDLLLLRNKLYILYGDKPGKGTQPSEVFDGKHVIKAALHGFAGTTGQLEKLVVTDTRKYSTAKVNRLRAALKRDDQIPNDFRRQGYTLKVGKLPVH